jgi:plastocyanin
MTCCDYQDDHKKGIPGILMLVFSFGEGEVSMPRTLVTPSRRLTLWTTLLCLVILTLTLAACGDSGSTTSSTSSTSSSASSAGSPTTITITEKTGSEDIYAFDPLTVTIKAGGALKFVNNSDENHKLASDPVGPTIGTVTKSGSNDNTLTVTFPSAGTFTISSTLIQRADKDKANEGADSKAKLTVTVQ